MNAGGEIVEKQSQRSNPGRGILAEESCRRNPRGGIMQEKSRTRNPGGGILEKECWRRNLGQGALEEESCRGKGSGRIWTSTQEASGSTWEPPGVIWSTFWAERQSVLNLLCLSTKSDAIDHFACTGARQHARSPQPVHKSWSS